MRMRNALSFDKHRCNQTWTHHAKQDFECTQQGILRSLLSQNTKPVLDLNQEEWWRTCSFTAKHSTVLVSPFRLTISAHMSVLQFFEVHVVWFLHIGKLARAGKTMQSSAHASAGHVATNPRSNYIVRNGAPVNLFRGSCSGMFQQQS